ncbi:TetR family transcriptional regulator, partial [Pseudomonas sp. FW305-BF6]
DEQERDNLMENMVSGAIERLLAPKTRNWVTTANAGDSTKPPTTK